MRPLARGCLLASTLMTASCLYDWTVVPKDDGEEPDQVPAPTKACSSNDDCGSSSYCKWSDGLCGKGESGKCTERPSSCTKQVLKCACPQLKLESGVCSLAAKGVDVGTCQ